VRAWPLAYSPGDEPGFVGQHDVPGSVARRLNFARMRPTWVLVVCSAITSRSLISAFDRVVLRKEDPVALAEPPWGGSA
jgi:hypothetical protein